MKLSQSWLLAVAVFASSAACAAPSVTLATSTDHPKAADKVSGSGFRASELVRIYWDTTNILLAVTDGSGNFGPLKFKVPGDALPGEHWVTAAGKKSGDAAQAPFTVSTPWTEAGFSVRGKRDNSYENILSGENVSGLESAWTATVPNPLPPVIAQGVAYVGSNDGNLYAFDIATGAKLWSEATGGEITSTPAVENGIVYIGSADHNLYAFDGATGALKWTGLTAGPIESSPTVSNGVVYIGSTDQQLWTFDANTGAKGWFAGTGGSIFSTPAVANGIVYIGSQDGKVYAFNASTGAGLWTVTTGGAIFSSPAASGAVYVTSRDGMLYALAGSTGATLWTRNIGGNLGSPAVANGVVYVGSDGGCGLCAFDAGTGDPKWETELGIGSPVIANGVAYIGSGIFDQHLYAFDAATGLKLWATLGRNIVGDPVISDGVLYFGDSGGLLYAYALDGGNSAVYRHKHTRPPSYATLYPNLHLKISR